MSGHRVTLPPSPIFPAGMRVVDAEGLFVSIDLLTRRYNRLIARLNNRGGGVEAAKECSHILKYSEPMVDGMSDANPYEKALARVSRRFKHNVEMHPI